MNEEIAKRVEHLTKTTVTRDLSLDYSRLALEPHPDLTVSRIVGYASVYGVDYPVSYGYGEFTERVMPGAFKRTLAASPHVVLRVDHTGLPLASTENGSLRLMEDDVGLRFSADLDLRQGDVADVYAKMHDGTLTGASFMGRMLRDNWSADYGQRSVHEISLERGDVSVVTFGASPTATSGPAPFVEPAPSLDDAPVEEPRSEPPPPVTVVPPEADRLLRLAKARFPGDG